MNYDGKPLPTIEQVLAEFNTIVKLLPSKNLKQLNEKCKQNLQLQELVFDQENQNDMRYDQELSIIHNNLSNSCFNLLLLQLLAKVFSEKLKQPIPQFPELYTEQNISEYLQNYEMFLQQIENAQQSMNGDDISNLFKTNSQNFNSQILLDAKKMTYDAHREFWPIRKQVGDALIDDFKHEKEKQIQRTNQLNQELTNLSTQYMQQLSSLEGLVQTLKEQVSQLTPKSDNEYQIQDLTEIQKQLNTLQTDYATKYNQLQVKKAGGQSMKQKCADCIGECIGEINNFNQLKDSLKDEIHKIKHNYVINTLQRLTFDENTQTSLKEKYQNLEICQNLVSRLINAVDQNKEEELYDLLSELMDIESKAQKINVSLNQTVLKLKQLISNDLLNFSSVNNLNNFIDQTTESLDGRENVFEKLLSTQNNIQMQLKTLNEQLSQLDDVQTSSDPEILKANLSCTAASAALDTVISRASERAVAQRNDFSEQKTDAIRAFVISERRQIRDKYEVALQLLCPVCLSRPIQAILECGHPMCRQCAQSLVDRSKRNARCHVCQSQVEKFYNIRLGGVQ